MAKRASDEGPYRPLLEAGLISAAIAPMVPAIPNETAHHTAKIVEMPRADNIKRETLTRSTQQDPAPKSIEQRAPQLNTTAMVEKFDQEKRVLFTRSETQAIDRLVTSLATRLNSQVKASHVMRALVSLLLHAEGELDKRAGEIGSLVRPPNGDAQALQRFEREIARIIGAAVRDAGPIRSE